jgi:hypothetical protein
MYNFMISYLYHLVWNAYFNVHLRVLLVCRGSKTAGALVALISALFGGVLLVGVQLA